MVIVWKIALFEKLRHRQSVHVLREGICNGIPEEYEYLINWMAFCVQFPQIKPETAIVLQGGQGVGKGKTVNVFGKLFGIHYMHVTNTHHIVGNFNCHLRSALLVFMDEAYWGTCEKKKQTFFVFENLPQKH